MDPKVVRVSSPLALAVYAESLAERGHVTVIGDSSSGLGSLLVRLGARAVEVWDPDGARAQLEAERAPRGVTVRSLSREQPEVRDVDLVVIPDLGCLPEPEDLLARVRRMLGDEGAAVVAAANPEAIGYEGPRSFDYYELFDLVAKEFDCVRMVAELPFHGVTLAELGDEDHSPAVNVDTQLADTSRSPQAFIALASQRDVRLDAYSIVELPPAPPPSQVAPAPLEEDKRRSRALGDENDELRAHAADRDRLAEAAVALERALIERSATAEEVAVALAERTRQLARVSLDLEDMRLRTEAQPDDHVRFEEALRERARALRSMEAELLRRDGMIRELASALEEASASGPAAPAATFDARDEENARLRERLDALALDLARREGEGQAAVWKIAELERRLARTAGVPEGAPEPGSRLAAALDEVDALRRALVQEHDARVRAESEREPRAEEARAAAAAAAEDRVEAQEENSR